LQRCERLDRDSHLQSTTREAKSFEFAGREVLLLADANGARENCAIGFSRATQVHELSPKKRFSFVTQAKFRQKKR